MAEDARRRRQQKNGRAKLPRGVMQRDPKTEQTVHTEISRRYFSRMNRAAEARERAADAAE